MSERKTFRWMKKNERYEELKGRYPNTPERLPQGEIFVSEQGVQIAPDDDGCCGGEVPPKEALELAREIRRYFAQEQEQKVPMRLILHCVECGDSCEAPFSADAGEVFTTKLYREHRWFLSVVTPPGSGKVTLAPVCPICATDVLAPELIAEFKRMHGEGGTPNPNVTVSQFDARYGKKPSWGLGKTRLKK